MSRVKEGIKGFIKGAVSGGSAFGSAVGTISAAGVPGLSAVGVTSGLKAVGFGLSMSTGVGVVAVGGLGVGYVAWKGTSWALEKISPTQTPRYKVKVIGRCGTRVSKPQVRYRARVKS